MITPSDALIHTQPEKQFALLPNSLSPSFSLPHSLSLSLSVSGVCCLAHAGLFMGILYNTSSTNMFAKCVRILYGNITVLLAVFVVAFCARFRSL